MSTVAEDSKAFVLSQPDYADVTVYQHSDGQFYSSGSTTGVDLDPEEDDGFESEAAAWEWLAQWVKDGQ